MLRFKAKIEPLAVQGGAISAFPSEHLLFSVRHSAGRLRMVSRDGGKSPYEDADLALVWDDTPLLRLHASGCPTCESLLAAGYGLPEGDPALREMRDAVNRPYGGLRRALEDLRPVVELLEPGLYVLSYGAYCPTDGEGRFFWDVPEDLTAYQATAMIYDGWARPCFPCFLYPSQPAAGYDAARAAHYRRMIRAGETPPPALCYAAAGYMSVLLDGHHRACACALEGVRTPCLTVSRPGYILRDGVERLVWPDGGETDAPQCLPPALRRRLGFRRPPQARVAGVRESRARVPWPKEYAVAAARYPTCREAGALALYPATPLREDGLRRLCLDEDFEDVSAAACLLSYAARQPGADGRALAMAFVGPENPYELRLAAFKVLDRIKGDPEIDDLMVRVLVESERRDTPFYQIADHHWDDPPSGE